MLPQWLEKSLQVELRRTHQSGVKNLGLVINNRRT